MSKNLPQGRRNIALALCIIMGLVIGIFIKRVSVGLLMGVVIGVLVGGMWVNRK